MELNELKNIWRRQQADKERDYSQSELMLLINNKMLSLEKQVKSRDRIEIIACAALVLFFGYTLVTAHSLWTQIGSTIIVAAAIFIGYRLKSSQIEKQSRDDSYNHSMAEHLQQELNQVRQQKKLLENIAWWYISPIVVGLAFLAAGFETGLLSKVTYMAVVLVCAVLVWYFNQRAVRRKFDPLIQELNKAITSLNEGEG